MRRLLAGALLIMFHAGFVRPVLRFVIGVRFRRAALVPRGPCVVVSNHNSHLDAAALMCLFPLRRLFEVHPVAAADYFGSSWFLNLLAMLCMNGIPLERRPRPGQPDPLTALVEALEAGRSLIFFPEGSRGEAGVVAPFRPGIGRLVQRLPGLLVVPVYLSGPERIWPRGQVVPVPGAIDVIVGKPRTYTAHEDPKLIADEVRRDVLQLAPPAPPTPGPQPRPVRVAVCGLDAGARRDVFRRLCLRLGRLDHALGISDPVVEADAAGLREVTAPVPQPRVRAWIGALARLFRTGGSFKGERFAEMIDRAQIDEALGTRPAARFVVTEASPLVDLLAWAEADFYRGVFDEAGLNHILHYLAGEKQIPFSKWWSFVRKAPEIWLINTFELAQPPVPDVLVFVDVPIPRVLERLRLGGERLEPYENEGFLGRLVEGYRQAGRVLGRRRKVVCIELDPAHDEAEARLDEVVAACRRIVEQPAEPALVPEAT